MSAQAASLPFLIVALAASQAANGSTTTAPSPSPKAQVYAPISSSKHEYNKLIQLLARVRPAQDIAALIDSSPVLFSKSNDKGIIAKSINIQGLPEGAHTLTLRDPNILEDLATVQFTIDRTPPRAPTLVLRTPTHLVGTCEEGSNLVLRGSSSFRSVATCRHGTFITKLDAPIADGTTINVTAVDPAGNAISTTLNSASSVGTDPLAPEENSPCPDDLSFQISADCLTCDVFQKSRIYLPDSGARACTAKVAMGDWIVGATVLDDGTSANLDELQLTNERIRIENRGTLTFRLHASLVANPDQKKIDSSAALRVDFPLIDKERYGEDAGYAQEIDRQADQIISDAFHGFAELLDAIGAEYDRDAPPSTVVRFLAPDQEALRALATPDLTVRMDFGVDGDENLTNPAELHYIGEGFPSLDNLGGAGCGLGINSLVLDSSCLIGRTCSNQTNCTDGLDIAGEFGCGWLFSLGDPDHSREVASMMRRHLRSDPLPGHRIETSGSAPLSSIFVGRGATIGTSLSALRSNRVSVIETALTWTRSDFWSLGDYREATPNDLALDGAAVVSAYPTVAACIGNTHWCGTARVALRALANGLVVGASDFKANTSQADDENAGFTCFVNPTSPMRDIEVPHITAPGQAVMTIDGPLNGTSFSTPIVAGAAARLQSK